jgi:hypothetical protein
VANNVAGTEIVIANVRQDFPDFIQWRRLGFEQEFRGVGIAQNCAQGLINLVCDRRA